MNMKKAIEKSVDPSKPLLNVRHELFCQLYAGKCWGNGAKAYRQAYDTKAQDASASNSVRLLAEFPTVQERVRYLRAQNFKVIEMDREEILQILGEIARGKLQTFVSKDGTITIHGKENERAIEALEVTEYLDGETPKRVRKIKLRSPVEAIDKICKIVGLDSPQKIELTGSVLVIQ